MNGALRIEITSSEGMVINCPPTQAQIPSSLTNTLVARRRYFHQNTQNAIPRIMPRIPQAMFHVRVSVTKVRIMPARRKAIPDRMKLLFRIFVNDEEISVT